VSKAIALESRDTLAAARAPEAGDPPPGFELDTVSGRDFAGLRLPLAAVKGQLTFRGNRAWAWTEDERPAFLGAIDAPVHRLLLDGDVRIRVGFYEFASSRAVIWIQRVEGATDGTNVHQAFIYLDKAESPEADAATSVFSDRLPIRAVIDVEGGVSLKADLVTPARPNDALILDGEAALAKSIRNWLSPPEPVEPDTDAGAEASPASQAEPPPAGVIGSLAPAEVFEPIFARSGIISISPGDITLVSGEEENSVLVSGGVSVQYTDLARDRSLRLGAQRAVIFLPPGDLGDLARLNVKDVRGIYLEGDVVATDGKYTLRGPRVYYDLRRNRAIVLDAVFWTYETHRRLPLYMRASAIRQESASQFVAERARITTTAFFDPELSVGASSVTISRIPRSQTAEEAAEAASGVAARGSGPIEAGIGALGLTDSPAQAADIRNYVEAEDITLRAAGLPIFYWPTYAGDPEQVPLRDIRLENSSGSGGVLKTTWNAYGLLGLPREKGFDADVMIDAYFERGIAIGTKLDWRNIDRRGSAFAYLVPYDTGTDLYAPGTEFDRDGETRAIVYGENIETIDRNWKLFLEGSYISDESFIDAFFEDRGRNRREFTNKAYLRYIDEESMLSLEAKGNANDFIANEWLLQTPGYTVAKTPEVFYSRLFDDPIGAFDGEPGPVLWTHEYRFSRMEMQFDEPLARERGFTSDSLARRAFGIGRTESIARRLRSRGYIEDGVFRADTRQELDVPLEAGPVKITPFAVGRATAWDNDFPTYSPDENENLRLWYGGGVRLSTTMQRVDDTVDSRMLDLHRIRHIVTPYVTLWQSGTNVDRVDLPVYDEEIEGITEGGVANIGIEQVWQTQRGTAGRWHSVDVFKLDVAYTTASDDSDRESPIGRFIDYRPELSYVGDFITLDGVWQVTDVLALSGSTVYDLDINQQARSALGMIVQHYPDFSTFVELRAINSEDSSFLDFGQSYKLSQKYLVAWVGSYETREGGLQSIGFEVQRSFPTAEFGFSLSYSEITEETSFGFVFRPTAARGQGARLRGLGSSSDRNTSSRVGG
jgi:hypothetical protein